MAQAEAAKKAADVREKELMLLQGFMPPPQAPQEVAVAVVDEEMAAKMEEMAASSGQMSAHMLTQLAELRQMNQDFMSKMAAVEAQSANIHTSFMPRVSENYY